MYQFPCYLMLFYSHAELGYTLHPKCSGEIYTYMYTQWHNNNRNVLSTTINFNSTLRKK